MTKTAHSDNIPLAVTAIVVAVFALSMGDALIKITSTSFVLWQIFVLRSLLVLPVLIIVLWARAPNAFAVPREWGWIVLRSTLMVAMWVAYYAALPRIDLSLAAAAYYTAPIFITLFSALFLRDRISRLGWIAVLFGFLGVLLVLRPRAEALNAYTLLPVGSAVLYALGMILTRAKCREAHPIVLAIGLNAAFAIVGGAVALSLMGLAQEQRDGFLTGLWGGMSSLDWTVMTFLALAALIGSVGAAIAYQKGPPSVVGVFDFSYVGFAVLWGAVFLAERPDAISLTGMGLIVLAGILSVRQ